MTLIEQINLVAHGSSTTISMNSSAYFGTGVDSEATNNLNTATMDHTTTVP